MNSSVSLPITDDTGVVFKHVAFSLQKSYNGSPWFSVSPKLFNNIIHSERCAIPTVWVKDFLCTSQNPPGGYIMLFVLSVQMKPETIYYHPDIASLLLEWWLGMAEQKFMNSQCERLGRESGWRSWRHKAKRQLVFLFLCHGVRKCFIFCGEKEIQRTELTFIEAKWWTIWFRKGTVSGDVKKAVISSDRSRGRECWYPWPVNCSLCQMYRMGSSEVLCSPRTVNTALSKSMTHWNEISFKLDLFQSHRPLKVLYSTPHSTIRTALQSPHQCVSHTYSYFSFNLFTHIFLHCGRKTETLEENTCR